MKRFYSLVGAALIFVPVLSGCGMKPLYAGGAGGAAGSAIAAVDVAPIEGKAGWLVRNALIDRMGSGGSQSPRYRLIVTLRDEIIGFGVRTDDTVTRERRTLRARFQLVDISNGAQLLAGSAGSDAGIDVSSSEYATIAAENTALENLSQEIADQIVNRLAVTLRARSAP